MRRSIPLLLTCLLALATGLALLGAGVMVMVPAPQTASSAAPQGAAAANAVLVRRFYDAVNTTLATGDAAPLAALVASDFIDRAAHPGHAPTRDGLLQHLLTLRASFPTMWIVVDDLEAQGDWVLARVRVEGLAQGGFLGMPFSGGPAAWTGLDIYRIAGGRIAERWAAGDWPVLPQPLLQVPLTEPPAGAIVRLARLTFAPGAHQPAAGSLGPLLVAVETGTLTVRVEREAVLARGEAVATSDPHPTTVSPGAEVTLRPGDGLLLSSGVRNAFHNAGQTPAVVLALTLLPWSAGAPDGGTFRWPESGSPDITAQLLADGVAADLPTGPAVIGLGRVTIAAKAELVADGATAPRLAVVEAGTLHLATVAGPVSTLSVGQGTLIEPGSGPTLRNIGDGPLVVLLATITPVPAANELP